MQQEKINKRKEPYKLLTRSAFEVGAIVLGISLSFWAENTRRHNIILKEEKIALERINNNLVQDTLAISETLESYEFRVDILKLLVDHINADTALSENKLNDAFLAIFLVGYPTVDNSSYEALIKHVGHKIIQNDTVALSIAKIYEKVYKHFDILLNQNFKMWNFMDSDFYNAGGYFRVFDDFKIKKLQPFENMAEKLFSDERFLRRLDIHLTQLIFLKGEYENSLYQYRYTLSVIKDYQDDRLLNESVSVDFK